MSAQDPLVGSTIGRYVLESKIGEGGMGRVYRAHVIDDPKRPRVTDPGDPASWPGRPVALKVLLGDLAASTIMRQRFAREAESARHLDHPNVVRVLDFGHTEGGLPYFAMELVEGTNLALMLQKGPMQGDRVIRIARQLCEALDHAHSRGVIHRDFKPDNILVIDEGGEEHLKVADFGLALSQNDDSRLTVTGVACTPAYAAPEQLRGDTIDSRVDLYALGTTMFEMLTGGLLPFEADLQGTIRLKLAGEAPNLSSIVPDMQPALATLVARLLSYDPNRRPRSARSLIIALDAALKAPKRKLRTQDLGPQAKGHTVSFPPTRFQRAQTKRIRKAQRPSNRTYVALAVAAVMIGAALASILRDREPVAEARTIREPTVTMTVEAQPVALTVPVATTPAAKPVVAVAPMQPTPRVASKRVVHRPKRVVRRARPAHEDPTPMQPDAIFEDTPRSLDPTPAATPAQSATQPAATSTTSAQTDADAVLDALPASVDKPDDATSSDELP